MPQMMPINWLMLMIFFFIVYLLFIIMNYYNINNKPIIKSMMQFKIPNIINWKW